MGKTKQDEVELISTVFTFPKLFKFQDLDRMEWDFSETGAIKKVATLNIQLNGSPSFFRLSKSPPVLVETLQPIMQPNGPKSMKLLLPENAQVSIKMVNKKGIPVSTLVENQMLSRGQHILPINVRKKGIYFVQMEINGKKMIQKLALPQE